MAWGSSRRRSRPGPQASGTEGRKSPWRFPEDVAHLFLARRFHEQPCPFSLLSVGCPWPTLPRPFPGLPSAARGPERGLPVACHARNGAPDQASTQITSQAPTRPQLPPGMIRSVQATAPSARGANPNRFGNQGGGTALKAYPDPIGADGARGTEGDLGPAGGTAAFSSIGATCVTGSVDPTGPTGGTGGQGMSGPPGLAGAAGSTGSAGPKGLTGSKVRGLPPGPAGSPAKQGPTGPARGQGPAHPAGSTGSQGPTGPTSRTGSTGPARPTGPAGADQMAIESMRPSGSASTAWG